MSLQKTKRANNKEKIILLTESTGTWGYENIMKYFGVSYGTANNTMRQVEDVKGQLEIYRGKRRRRVRINDVLGLYGTSREEELRICMMKEQINGI